MCSTSLSSWGSIVADNTPVAELQCGSSMVIGLHLYCVRFYTEMGQSADHDDILVLLRDTLWPSDGENLFLTHTHLLSAKYSDKIKMGWLLCQYRLRWRGGHAR